MTVQKKPISDFSSIPTAAELGEEVTRGIDKEEHKRNLRAAQTALSAEFHALIGDTERLLSQTAEVAGAQATELRAKISENLSRAKDMLKDTEVTLQEQGRAAVQATEEYVHSHPWQTLGIAASVGFLLGLLAGRR